jgi:hypothetical protein
MGEFRTDLGLSWRVFNADVLQMLALLLILMALEVA